MPWERIVSLCLFRAVAVASRTLSSPSSSSTDGPRRVIVIARSSSRARASTCADDDAKFRPFGRARGGDGYMSLRFVFIDYTCTRVCTICPRRDGWDMDRLDRTHRTHSYSRRSYTHQSTHRRPHPARERSVERSVERPSPRPVVVVVRTRRRFAPAMSATAQFSSSAITGCVFARRDRARVRKRASSFPNPDRSGSIVSALPGRYARGWMRAGE